MKPVHMLIVEDDENDVLLMVRALEEYGLEPAVTWTDNAVDMEQALHSTTFDVVIADFRLPRFSGLEALELLKRMEIDTPFILVSATVADEVAVDLMRRGARDYVMKDHLTRLGHAVEREVREYADRRERTAREQAFAATQRRFQETFEHAPIGIVHADLLGRVSMANNRFCEIIGYAREELLGRGLGELTHAGDLDVEHRGLADLYAGRRATHQAEKRYIRRDGTAVWVNFSATAVRSIVGEIEYVVGMVEDITRRREAEERIRFQAHLLDAVEQAVIAADLHGNVTFWSRYAADVYGWSAAEALGRHVVEMTSPMLSKEEAAAVMEKLTHGESWSGEIEMRRRDGRTFPAMAVASPIFGEDGSPLGSVGVSFDVSERKAAEAALVRSEERYRGVMEGVEELILSVDTNGNVTMVNRAFEVSTGWSREEIVGMPVFALSAPEDREELEERFQARLRGEILPPTERPILRKDGSLLHIETLGFVRHDDGKAAEVFYFCRDLSARRAAEQERARLVNELRLLLESTAEGIYSVDAQGNLTLVNRAAAQILGYPAESLLGRNSHELFHRTHPDGSPYDVEDCPLHRVLRTGCMERPRNEVYWRSDGAAVPVEYACAPILDNGVIVGAVTTFTDVSERRLLETQLERANRLNGLGRVAATMAHEMNNVLMGIQPFAEMLRRHVSGEKPLALIDAIEKSVRRGSRVTGEILRFARQSKPVLKPLKVSQLVQDLAVEAYAVLEPGIDFRVAFTGDPMIAGDARELQQTFVNLVVNARDAGAQKIELRVERTTRSRFRFGVVPDGVPHVHLSVVDDGRGMPPQMMEHVFEPLFTTKKSGTGLGLALARNVIEQHGGSIFVESREGEGSTFHIFLPLTNDEPAAIETAQPARPSGMHVVVLVEDEPAVAEGVATLLELDGFAVSIASTGAEAVEVVERTSPHAVILDVGLPDMDGTEVYANIAQRWPELPVVFASGHADASRFAEYLTRPNVAYVTKPYDLAELYSVLGGVLKGEMPEATRA